MKLNGIWEHFDLDTLPLPPRSSLYCMASGLAGRVWIGVFGPEVYSNGRRIQTDWVPAGGILLFDQGQWTFFRLGEVGLPNQTILAMACDPNGVLWLRMNWATICRFDGKTSDVFHAGERGLPPQSTWQVRDEFASGVPTDFWLVVSQAGAFRFNGSTWDCFTDENSLFEIGSDKGWITSAVIDPLGRTWFSICNPHDTVFVRYADNRWEEIARVPMGHEKQVVRCLAVDKHDVLWVAWAHVTGMGYGEGLWVYDSATKRWSQHRSKDSSLLSHEINTLAVDNSERIWVGTREGIAVFDNAESRCWTAIIPSQLSRPLRRRVAAKGWDREKVLRHVWVRDRAIIDNKGCIWARDHQGISVFTETHEDQAARSQ